jgi:hypothetical protein
LSPTDKTAQSVDGADLKIKLDKPQILFGYYMASFGLDKPGKIAFNARIKSGSEFSESRQIINKIQAYSLTGGLAQVMEPKGNDVDMNINYSSESGVILDIDKEVHNLSLGSVLLPPGSVYKHTNSKLLKFTRADKDFKALDNFNLSILNNKEKPANYLVFYNLALPLNGEYNFTSRLNANLSDDDIKLKTTLSAIKVQDLGLHSAAAIKVPAKGKVEIKLEYKFTGDRLEINDPTQDKYAQSIIGLELPDNSKVHNFKAHSADAIDLNTGNEWRELPIEASVNVDKKKSVIIIYSYNIKVDKKDFSMRIRIGNKYNKKSVISNSGLDYSFGTGYVIRSLLAGTHRITIDFKSNSENRFNPNSKSADEHVHLTAIELD